MLHIKHIPACLHFQYTLSPGASDGYGFCCITLIQTVVDCVGTRLRVCSASNGLVLLSNPEVFCRMQQVETKTSVCGGTREKLCLAPASEVHSHVVQDISLESKAAEATETAGCQTSGKVLPYWRPLSARCKFSGTIRKGSDQRSMSQGAWSTNCSVQHSHKKSLIHVKPPPPPPPPAPPLLPTPLVPSRRPLQRPQPQQPL